MICPNRNHPDWKKLVNKVGFNRAYLEFYKNGREIPNPDNIQEDLKGINASMKVIGALAKIGGHVSKYNRRYGNGTPVPQRETIRIGSEQAETNFRKTLSNLGVPNNQIDLTIDYIRGQGLSSIKTDDLIMGLIENSSYTVEINTAKEDKIRYEESYSQEGELLGVYPIEEGKTDKPTQHYSNLTVPGGVNYTENEIATPAITPSVRGHAQFATDKGIGWFRSDDKTNLETSLKPLERSTFGRFIKVRELNLEDEDIFVGISRFERGLITKDRLLNEFGVTDNLQQISKDTKTRRILEVQSDLFQKGRNNDVLAGRDPRGKRLIDASQEQENFLQLLNKDNNWVTFFVKSIIQDSAKKGYNKVLFPKGDTASKIEGHATLEEFKKQKEDRIKELEKAKKEPVLYNQGQLISGEELSNKEGVIRIRETSYLEKAFPKYQIQTSLGTNEFGYTQWYKDGNFYYAELIKGEYYKIPERYVNEEIKKANEKNIKERNEDYDIEINQLKQELERIEKEGFGALKPIYNFYQNIVTNVLKKQGFNPKEITDEYGNKWNEITLSEEKGSTIFFQTSNAGQGTREEIDQLEEGLKGFLEANGISYEKVRQIRDRDGNKLTAIAAADMVHRTIQVVEGRADITTLPEEAAHFFIELLGENHPLYKSMFGEIDKYQVYQEVLEEYGETYKQDKVSLRKEAMAKAIAKIIVGEELEPRIKRWWNRVLSSIRDLFSNLIGRSTLDTAIIQYNPFGEAAQRILAGDRIDGTLKSKEEYEMEGSGGLYFQLSQAEVVSAIKSRHNVLKEGQEYSVEVNGNKVKVKNRITDRVKAYLAKKFPDSGRLNEEMYRYLAEYGTEGHADIENIIRREIAKRKGTLAPVQENKLPKPLYDILDRHFTELVQSIPADAEILVEQRLYNPAKDEAGTVDFIVVYNDGSVGILDWKFINFKNKKEIAWYKKDVYDIQLRGYQEILREAYGIESFKELRIIPISAKYKGKTLTDLTIGSTKIKDIPAELDHLKPLPAFEEMTGDEGLDRIISSLRSKIELENNKKAKSGATQEEIDSFKEKKNYNVARYQKAIRDIQLQHDIGEYVSIGLQTIKDLSEADITGMSLSEAEDLMDTMKFYGKETIGLVEQVIKEQPKEVRDQIPVLAGRAQLFESKLKAHITAKMVERHGVEIKEAQRESGAWQRMIRSISQQTDPIIETFWELVKKSHKKTVDKVQSLETKLREATEGIRRAQRDKSGVGIFDIFLETRDNGALRFTDKYSPEFRSELEKKRGIAKDGSLGSKERQAALSWLKDHLEFDMAGYESRLKAYTEAINKQYAFDENKDILIPGRIEEFKERYGPTYGGYSNPNNRLVKIKDNPKYYSEKYKTINSTPELKKFYDLILSINREFIDYTGLNRQGDFVWNVPNTLADSIFQNGITNVPFWKTIQEQLIVRPGETLGMVDPDTQKEILKVPVYYGIENTSTDADGNVVVDSRNQSRDLEKVFLIVAQMAYNHKHMSEIEESAKALQIVMQGRESILTDSRGNERKNKLTGRLQKILGASSTLEQFQDYINYYVYGKVSKTKDFIVTIGDKQYSSLAAYSMVSKAFVGKSLSFNLISVVAGAIGGRLNAAIVGAGGRYFSAEDFNTAFFSLIPSKNRKGFAFIDFFDLLDRENFRHKANNRSANWLSRTLTYENLFIGQKYGDWTIRNGVLLAMMKKYRVEGGKIVRLPENENSPTLFSYLQENDGKLDYGDLTVEELERFREIVVNVGDTIVGNTPRDDLRLYQLTIQGKVLGMFRSWIPRTVDTRFGELRRNKELGTYELGRYRSFFNQVINKQWKPLVWETIRGFGVFGYGGKFGQTTIEHAKSLWAEAIRKDPKLKISQQEYVELHLANLRSNMLEIYLVGTLSAMIMLLRGDDDEPLEQGSLRKYVYQQMDRIRSELSFYFNPAEFDKILKNPIPITRYLNDWYKLMETVTLEGTGVVTGQDDLTKPKDLRKYSFRVVPLLSGFESFLSFIDDEYDKSQAWIDNQKKR